ncbi:MAG: RHS repeat protein, partial [Deltaproteobacteria bacterium]|nr:RHS repeat protein [Deltaproteobacteria bacterium]
KRSYLPEQQASAPPPQAFDAAGTARSLLVGPGKATLESKSGSTATLVVGPKSVKVTSAAGNQTTMEFDSLGRLTLTRRPDGSEVVLARDAHGRVVELYNVSADERWRYAYDAGAGRLAQRIDPAGRSIRFSYDEAGRLLSRQDPSGQTSYAYEAHDAAAGLPTRRTDALERETRVEYDEHGNLQKLTAPGGLVTLVERDPVGRATKVVEPSGIVHRVGFDARDGVVLQALGEPPDERTMTYSRTLSDGWEAVGSHVPASALDSMVDAEGRTWSYVRDPAFQITEQTTPGEGKVQSAYDALGRRLRREGADGSVETFSYDEQGRMERRAFTAGPAAGASLELAYDELKRVTRLSDPEVVERRVFEPGKGWSMLEVTAASGPGTPAQFVVRRGRRSATTVAYDLSGVRLLLTRDFDDQVSKIERESSSDGALTELWSATFDATRQLVGETRANGVTTVLTYDTAGRVERQEERAPAGTLSITYTYDAAGRPATRTVEGAGGSTRTFAYDAQGLLASCSDTGESFTYDRNGARASARGASYARDPQGRLTSDGVYDYTHDAAGRRLTRIAKADASERTEYVWGKGGLLAEVRHGPAGASTLIARYAWDGSGRRILRQVGAQEWRYGYLPETDRPVRVRDAGGTEWHLAHATGAAAFTLAAASGGALRYTHLDPFDRVVAISDETGTLTRVEEDCYGQRLSGVAPSGPVASFHGIPYDEETKLYFAGPRPYDPATGEFLAPDPAGIESGADPFGYGGGNPILRADPSGRFLGWVAAGALLAGALIVKELHDLATGESARKTQESYKAITEAAGSDDKLAKANEAHANLAKTSVEGGKVAVKSVAKSVEAVTNPAGSASEFADKVKDEIKDAVQGDD